MGPYPQPEGVTAMSQIKRKHASRKHIATLIRKEVSWFIGWQTEHISPMSKREAMDASIDKAVTKILRYLRGKSLEQPR
jgi:hypothetical protein